MVQNQTQDIQSHHFDGHHWIVKIGAQVYVSDTNIYGKSATNDENDNVQTMLNV